MEPEILDASLPQGRMPCAVGHFPGNGLALVSQPRKVQPDRGKSMLAFKINGRQHGFCRSAPSALRVSSALQSNHAVRALCAYRS
jgi:hypothetical protein